MNAIKLSFCFVELLQKIQTSTDLNIPDLKTINKDMAWGHMVCLGFNLAHLQTVI